MSVSETPPPRIIPCLTVTNGRLVKTVGFDHPTYVGDPRNAARIFDEKDADEIVLLDIRATVEGRPPPLALIEDVALECSMPLCYGGGVRTFDDVSRIMACGVEKICLGAAAIGDPGLVEEVAARLGSQSVVVSIDVRRKNGRPHVYEHSGRRASGLEAVEYAQRMQQCGAGEILLTSIDRDGVRLGYDLDLVRSVCDAVTLPVIVCGGAGSFEHMREAVTAGASGVAAGSFFVHQGPNRAVLISYSNTLGAAALTR